MCEQSSLELIKSRSVLLKEGQQSSEIVLKGDEEGDMFFSFLLKYVHVGSDGQTILKIIDDFHAELTIETQPSAFTRLNEPIEIGTYQSKTLYLGIAVNPCNTLNEHEVTITFYTDKE